MAGYWLKLYTEILDDPKYFRLSDNAKLGMIELMIVAKKVDMDGLLPPQDDVSFFTRRINDWWKPVYDELVEIKFLDHNDNGFFIRKFSERQAAITDAERAKRSREKRNVSQPRHEPVTKRDGETEEETESDTEKKDAGEIFKTYENNISILTPIISQKIGDAIDTYPHQWILDAIGEAVKHNARNWAYIEKILKNWQSKGRGDHKPIDGMSEIERELLRRGYKSASES